MASPKNEVKRVYRAITQDLAVASDEALVNGKTSNLPLGPGEYQIESIEDLKNHGYPIDYTKSLVGGGAKKGQVEKGHFEFRFLLPDTKKDDGSYLYAEKGLVKIGVSGAGFVFSNSESVEGLVVSGGNFGENTLEHLATLADNGAYLKIEAMHLDADDDRHYTSKMIERSWSHDGTGNADRNIFYPKALSNDTQTNIRSITELNTYLTGAGYLEMPIYRGVGVNVTITTEYQRK
jgi:hypothetical protein